MVRRIFAMAGRTDVCGDNPVPCCSLAIERPPHWWRLCSDCRNVRRAMFGETWNAEWPTTSLGKRPLFFRRSKSLADAREHHGTSRIARSHR